jgi:organic hydroperoxide reductase OsmC/OhrA
VGFLADGIDTEITDIANRLERKDLDRVVAKAKEVCPYSRATHGNVTTNIEVVQL